MTITAEEARKRLRLDIDKSDNMNVFFSKVEAALKNKQHNFTTQLEFTPDERIRIRELGYGISYNRACSWYEVNF